VHSKSSKTSRAVLHFMAVARHYSRAEMRGASRWKYNIKVDLQELSWGGVNWIGLAEVRDRWRALANAVVKLRVP